ncbi:MAG: lysine transporter [Parachlamydiales bacterium]|nr:lysine transporter [Parachlamydiales bacterium]
MECNSLHRRLSARHIAMIAIGGSIGSGIFVASGTAIHTAGPGGALLAYLIMSMMVYFLMTSLGEMSTLLPTTGSFCDYATRFVDPAFGFAMSYNYWLNWAVTTAVDLSAAALIIHTWVPEISFFAWTVIFFVLIVLMNIVPVAFYGEMQYWFSGIKVAAVILFILIGIFVILGIVGHQKPLDWTNWTIDDAPFHSGWVGFMSVLMIAGFSFQGTEIFGITAGETKDPTTSIPKAVRNVFWRIVIFYILTMGIISFLVPYNNPLLIVASTTNVGASPFTIILQMAGLHFAQVTMTIVILLAILSAANASMYTAARTLWHIAREGNAPRFLMTTSKRHGIPIAALVLTSIISAAVFLSSQVGSGQLFVWLLNISSLTGFIAWFGIALCHYRFRKAYLAQGRKLSDLPYLAKGFPFGSIFALVLCVFVIAGQQFDAWILHNVNLDNLIGTYIGLPIFMMFYLGFKFWNRTKLIPLTECSFKPEM